MLFENEESPEIAEMREVIRNAGYTFTVEDTGEHTLGLIVPPPYKSSNKSGTTFFQHCNFGGYRVTLPVGNYNFGDILAQGIKNDDLSSVRVPVGTMPIKSFEFIAYLPIKSLTTNPSNPVISSVKKTGKCFKS